MKDTNYQVEKIKILTNPMTADEILQHGKNWNATYKIIGLMNEEVSEENQTYRLHCHVHFAEELIIQCRSYNVSKEIAIQAYKRYGFDLGAGIKTEKLLKEFSNE